MSKSSKIAENLVAEASKLGWEVYASGNILTITKRFPENDMDALVKCDTEYYGLFALVPVTSNGSIWGTDCGGIGALSALEHGYFKMNRSGCDKRVLKALTKIG